MGRYDLALKIGAEFWRYTVEFILNPSQWSALTLPVTLNWNIVRFSQNQVLNVQDDEVGVYSFVVKPDIANHSNCSYLMYVGQTTDQSFRTRYRQYLQYQRTQTGSLPTGNRPLSSAVLEKSKQTSPSCSGYTTQAKGVF